MSVRKRNDRWEVRLRIGDGKRIEKTLPAGASKQDALALEASFRRQQVDHTIGRPRRYTIAEAMDRWEIEARSLKSWQRDMRYKASVVRQIAGTMPLSDLPALAQEIKKRGRDSGASIANINRHLAIVRRIGNLGERWGWASAIGRRVQLLPGERTRDARLSDAQCRSILVSGSGIRDYLEFLVLTGLRRSEALRVTQDDIKGGVLVVDSRSKSGKTRLIPLAPRARLIASRSIPFGLTVSEVRRQWEAARRAAKVPWARLHDLRHYFGSKLVETGADAATVRDLLGHSSLAVTSRYVHSLPAASVQAVKRLKIGGRVGARR